MKTLDTYNGQAKPLTLRAIFILNALKIMISTGLFIGFKFFDLSVGTVTGESAATLVGFTTLGYLLTFAAMVAFILNRSILGVRITFVVDFLISIPAKAFIGFAVAAISITLTFSAPVKRYFSYRG